jgi:predicted MFS family arabinose efflux permease
MIALATVLLVSNVTGSYAYAGALSALFALTAALVSIATSRWADSIGQTSVLRLLGITHSLLIVAFTVSIIRSFPAAAQVTLVVAAGGTSPAIGSYVRARWAALSTDSSIARIGFAWESILDEVIFTVGPLVTTYAAFAVGFSAPLWIAAGCVAVGSMWLAAAKSTTPAPHPTTDRGMSFSRVVRSPGLRPIVLSALGLGTLFGSLDVGIVAFTAEQGNGTFAGVALACFAGASMLGGILYGVRQWPTTVVRHTQLSALALMLVVIALPFVPGNPTLAIIASIAGFCVAPTLIGLFSLTSVLVPARHVTEGLTWTNSGLAFGFAVGSALAGILVDSFGPRSGLAMGLVGAVVAASAVFARSRILRERYEIGLQQSSADEPPVAAWNDDPIAGPHPAG